MFRSAVSIFAVAFALGTLGWHASGQSSSAAYPDSTYFRYFFLHVTRVQSAADKLKAQEKKDDAMRNLLKNRALLTNQEYAMVLNLAQGCNVAFGAASRNAAAAASQVRQQYPSFASLPQSAVQELSGLDAQRTEVIEGCMANLKAQMGPSRYQLLRNFVVVSEAQNMQPVAGAGRVPAVKSPPMPAN